MNTQPTNEEEIMKQILDEINKYKQNQKEFIEAIDEFFLKSNEILDNE
ncbi:hypothetical protein [Flavobacterium muglaense]|uniref:Uncharacterized protein n=1 Tax=Flavobacterium muglaense TaxID=2764716 RepID=A0A923MXD9_9FLAO|nr:hypothetical protein [Flavobacterium muglaense]MBC5836803.1 hypothetical protein [Flavobacterium muglaense]MBC5843247.1 hypothetical protein [Flavobacterium muglaense]